MKKPYLLLLISAIAIIGSFLIPKVFATSVPVSWWTDGLVGYWSFDGQFTTSTAGTRDTSSNNNWGAFNGGVKPVGGVVGQALSFDGVDDYISMGDVLDFERTDSFSIAFWIKHTATTIYNIVSKQNSLSPWQGYTIETTSGNKLRFALINSVAANNFISVDFPDDYNDGQWHYIVVTYGGTSNVAGTNLYADGASVPKTTITDSLSATTITSFPFQISARNGANLLFNGLLDEVRIYNRVLSADEVKQHFEQTRRNFVIDPTKSYKTIVGTSVPSTWWTDGLVGYWSFDGQYTTSTSGTRDTSGQNNWGTFVNGVKPAGGVVGQALSFDGANDYVQLPNTASLQFGTGDFTVEFWMKATTWFTYMPLISNCILVGGDWNGLMIGQEEQPAMVLDSLRVDVLNKQVRGTTPLVEGTWYHAAVTRTSGTVRIYINAVQDGIGTAAGNVTNGTAFMLGRNPDTTYPRNYNGFLDEVRIYNRALSADEVMEHYLKTKRNLVL